MNRLFESDSKWIGRFGSRASAASATSEEEETYNINEDERDDETQMTGTRTMSSMGTLKKVEKYLSMEMDDTFEDKLKQAQNYHDSSTVVRNGRPGSAVKSTRFDLDSPYGAHDLEVWDCTGADDGASVEVSLTSSRSSRSKGGHSHSSSTSRSRRSVGSRSTGSGRASDSAHRASSAVSVAMSLKTAPPALGRSTTHRNMKLSQTTVHVETPESFDQERSTSSSVSKKVSGINIVDAEYKENDPSCCNEMSSKRSKGTRGSKSLKYEKNDVLSVSSKSTLSNRSDTKSTLTHRSDAKSALSHRSDAKSTLSHRSDTKSVSSHTSDAKSTFSHRSDAKSTLSRRSVAKSTLSKRSDVKSTTSERSENKSTTSQRSENKSTTSQRSENKSTTSHRSENKSTTSSRSETKSTSSRKSSKSTSSKRSERSLESSKKPYATRESKSFSSQDGAVAFYNDSEAKQRQKALEEAIERLTIKDSGTTVSFDDERTAWETKVNQLATLIDEEKSKNVKLSGLELMLAEKKQKMREDTSQAKWRSKVAQLEQLLEEKRMEKAQQLDQLEILLKEVEREEHGFNDHFPGSVSSRHTSKHSTSSAARSVSSRASLSMSSSRSSGQSPRKVLKSEPKMSSDETMYQNRRSARKSDKVKL